MSIRDTTKLNPKDLKYLLIDSLKLYSDNVAFIDGKNPYRFSINKKTFYVLIRNVHESGDGRGNQDECRIQVSKTENFNIALNSRNDVIVLGYFADEKVFTAWNPFMMRDRFNRKQSISLYSRFSRMELAKKHKISTYVDHNKQTIISFSPEYLGLYFDNFESMHLLSEDELRNLASKSDALNNEGLDGEYDSSKGKIPINHSRSKRDPEFADKVYKAYNYKCAMCGIGLNLIEGAHIIPHSHELGTDEIDNGISLCSLHHTAYDKSLIYFDEEMNILINESKMEYLEKVGLDPGFRKFEKLAFEKIQLPDNHILRPNIQNIKIANNIRAIF